MWLNLSTVHPSDFTSMEKKEKEAYLNLLKIGASKSSHHEAMDVGVQQ